MNRQDRIECRAFARLFNTADGKLLLASIQRDIGWDTAGPRQEIQETTNGNTKSTVPAYNRDEWIGQRSVIVGILTKINLGHQIDDADIEAEIQ